MATATKNVPAVTPLDPFGISVGAHESARRRHILAAAGFEPSKHKCADRPLAQYLAGAEAQLQKFVETLGKDVTAAPEVLTMANGVRVDRHQEVTVRCPSNHADREALDAAAAHRLAIALRGRTARFEKLDEARDIHSYRLVVAAR